MPRSALLLCDSVQTQMSPLPAQKWEFQVMLHDTKTVVLVIFPRQEQSHHQVPEAGGKVSNDLGKQMSNHQGKQKHWGFFVVWLFVSLFCLGLFVWFLFQHCKGNCTK